ncbi:MAG TPA: hypothetical protein DCR12_00295 [Lachnospiraceae bacterium]|nr:hypothetical protein [Lachnospiraceae bacterium]
MRKHSMQNILVLIIFSIFAVLSLVLVAVGIKFYTNISNKVNDNSQMRNTVAYLENKIRSNDYKGGIDVVKIDGKDVLILSSTADDALKTAIYVDDGHLKEYLSQNDDVKLGYGDTIADVQDMNISKEGNNLNIVLDINNTKYVIQKSIVSGAL